MNREDYSLQNKLKRKLKQLAKIFNFDEVLAVNSNPQTISQYYSINKTPYSLFHSRAGLIHLGISRDLKYKAEDLLEPAKFVGGYIEKLCAKDVLEPATGRGANSLFLSRKFPGTKFCGLDLPNGHIDLAKSKVRLVNNFKVLEGDYHDLVLYNTT